VQAIKEKQVIDFEPTEQARDELPGAGEEAVNSDVQAFRETLDERASTEHGEQASPTPEESNPPAETDGGVGGDQSR